MNRQFPPIGMAPSVWGPIFWNTMHIVTLGYSHAPSKEEQDAANQFFQSLAYVIPCPVCKEHYAGFIQKSPPAVKNRNELINWIFELHNNVNEQLGKRKITWDEFVAENMKLSKMDSLSIPQRSSATNLTLAVTAGVIVGIAGVALYHKYK